MDKEKIDRLDEKVKEYFDYEAETYDKNRIAQFSRDLGRYMLNTVTNLEFETILDVGCGTGKLLYDIIDVKPQVMACAIDFSPRMIEIAHRRLSKKVDVRLSDFRNMSKWCNTKSFDIVIANDILRYVSEPQRLAEEVYRVLKLDGRFVICDAAPGNTLKGLKTMISRDVAQRPMAAVDIKSVLSEAGFNMVSYTKVENGICLITAYKRS